MKALSLFGVCVLAKLLILAGRHETVALSGWLPIAYVWQDALIAILFGLLDTALMRLRFGRALGWSLYSIAIAYITINVPVTRVLSSPLSWSMIGAARGTLWDSIRYHASTANIVLMATVIASGIGLPVLLRWIERRWDISIQHGKSVIAQAGLGLALMLMGPIAARRVETMGLERNAVVALVTTALPRVTARAGAMNVEEWRQSPLSDTLRLEDLLSAPTQDISYLHGTAAGHNVVLVLLESAGARYLKPLRAGADPMPNLTDLAKSSLTFDNAYSVYPESIKGLFSVLFSRYPAMDADTATYARVKTKSIAAEMREAGYTTALFHSGRFDYLGMRAIVENRGYEIVEDAGEIGGNHESSFGVDEGATVSRSLNWIDSVPRDRPFFLTYLPIAGHHPYETPSPGPFPEQQDSDRYLNALHYADESLGALLNGLRARGLYEGTLFVIFGDHGEAFEQHEGNYGHSLFLYEENIRVPYIIAAPGLLKEQVRVTKPISLIDTFPTILDLLGRQPPTGIEGMSALRNGRRMALFLTDYSLGFVGLRDDCRKYIYELDSARSKLFNLRDDPDETKDLSSTFPDQIDLYRSHLIRWSASQKALLSSKQ